MYNPIILYCGSSFLIILSRSLVENSGFRLTLQVPHPWPSRSQATELGGSEASPGPSSPWSTRRCGRCTRGLRRSLRSSGAGWRWRGSCGASTTRRDKGRCDRVRFGALKGNEKQLQGIDKHLQQGVQVQAPHGSISALKIQKFRSGGPSDHRGWGLIERETF